MFSVIHNSQEYEIGSIQSARREPELNTVPEINMIAIEDGPFNPAFPYLIEENVIKTDDGHEYRIKKVIDRERYKNIRAVHVVTDLNGVPFNRLLSGTYNLSQVTAVLFNGTGWTVTVDNTDLIPLTFKEWGEANVWALFIDACKKAKAEFIIRPNKNIVVAAKPGPNNGKQYVYGYNIRSLGKESETTNLNTRVIVKFGEDLKYQTEYISPNETTIGRISYAEMIKDERIVTQSAAMDKAKLKLVDTPKISYELDIAEFDEPVELGETVYTLYEPLNNLEIETRILKMKEEWNGDEFVLTDVTVGNTIFTTAEEEISENVNTTNDRVTETQQKVAVVKESVNGAIASITVLDEEIDLKVNKDGIISAINISPENITIQAEKINLNGAVIVNGSITGATRISVTESVQIGSYLYFGNNWFTSIASDGAAMALSSVSGITYYGPSHKFYGTVDFSSATVIGL